MKIDAYTNYNSGLNLNVYDLPQKQNVASETPVEAVKPVELEAFSVADIYERSASQPKTDFGGYTKTGRKQTDVQSERLKNYVVGNVANILKTNENRLSKRMDKLGLTTEDMVDPAKAMALSNNAAKKYQLFEYSMTQRNILKDEMKMNDSELDNFIKGLKNAGKQEEDN